LHLVGIYVTSITKMHGTMNIIPVIYLYKNQNILYVQ